MRRLQPGLRKVGRDAGRRDDQGDSYRAEKGVGWMQEERRRLEGRVRAKLRFFQ